MNAAAEAIKPDLVAPMDPITGELARATGETFRGTDGTPHMVYSMQFVDFEKSQHIDNREPVIDPETGKQLTRKGDHGPYKVWTRPTRWKEREFILERSGTGEVRILHDFRPSADERDLWKRQALVEQFSEQLAREAVKRAISRRSSSSACCSRGCPPMGRRMRTRPPSLRSSRNSRAASRSCRPARAGGTFGRRMGR